MKPSPKPSSANDRAQFFARFGCGFLFAIVFVVWLGLGIFDNPPNWLLFFVSCAIVGLIFGCLAAKYGDRFWQVLSNWLR